MSKKTNKHRAAKRVKLLPARPALPPSTRVTFFLDEDSRHRWRAERGGRLLAESAGGYSKKDKMKRGFTRLVDSFVSGDWIAADEGKS